jgi:hypothetical protein
VKDTSGSGRAKVADTLRARKAPQYLSQPAIGESVAELRPAFNRPEEQQVVTEQLNRGLPVSALHSPRERMIVPSQRQTVHRLLGPSLCVDYPGVVGYEQIEEFLPLFVALQAVDWKTFAAIVLEIATA